MQRYTVRLANAEEIECLPAIEQAAATRFLPYLDQLEITADLLEGLTPPRFLHCAQQEKRLWVAVVDSPSSHSPAAQNTVSQPVGFIVAKVLPSSYFIVELDVHPDFGRLGIGSALVEACCKSAASQNHSQVTLTTFRHIPWNIPFYQRLDFQILPANRWSPEIKAIVEHEARYGFAPEHRVVMARRLLRPVRLSNVSEGET
ncbi:MAG: GNAT family N-acetyltransferase [Cyanobacteria bacterium J06554_3]